MTAWKNIVPTALALSLLGGCSTLVRGTDQEIVINTNPAEAKCELAREGEEGVPEGEKSVIATLEKTPGPVIVKRTKYDITITCDKPGYQTATFLNDSGWESGSGAAGIALDVVLTLGMSSAIDSISGADNQYQTPVNITLLPDGDAPASDAAQPADADPAKSAAPAMPEGEKMPADQEMSQKPAEAEATPAQTGSGS